MSMQEDLSGLNSRHTDVSADTAQKYRITELGSNPLHGDAHKATDDHWYKKLVTSFLNGRFKLRPYQ